MDRRHRLIRMILAIVVALGLTPLMAVVDARGQIAFVSGRDGNAEIYVMDADGKNQRRLTNHPARDYAPSWSPDGKRIVFCSDRDGHPHRVPGWLASEIYVMAADGGNLHRLTNHPRSGSGPAWLNTPFSVAPTGKTFTIWGRVKQLDR